MTSLVGQTHGGFPDPILALLILILLVIWGGGGFAGVVSLVGGFFKARSIAWIFGTIVISLSAVWLAGCSALLVVSTRPATLAFNLLVAEPWGWTGLVPGLLGIAGIAIARRTQHNVARCRECDYDLRGSAHSATCPECGAPVPLAVREGNTAGGFAAPAKQEAVNET